MLVGTNLITNLSAAVTSSQTSLPLVSVVGLSVTSGNHAYMTLDDGVSSEIVKVTGVSGSSVTVERGALGTTPRAFVNGVCIKPFVGYEFICELIAQGGCSGTSTGPACVKVTKGGYSFPDAIIGSQWDAAATFNNATSISVGQKPSWVTETVAGQMVVFSGIPPVGTKDFNVVVIANGCDSSSIVVDRSIRICKAVGVAPLGVVP